MGCVTAAAITNLILIHQPVLEENFCACGARINSARDWAHHLGDVIYAATQWKENKDG